jgi:uncharacterized protein
MDLKMHRCNRIYNHPLFLDRMKEIEEKEKDRIFCLHNLSHALDVARIGYIMILEEKADIEKELFYAAALLHDAGRYSGKPHNESGSELSRIIMPECGFSESETELVASAILCHRKNGAAERFAEILYAADKKSRNCFRCEGAKECYWETEKRNFRIEI